MITNNGAVRAWLTIGLLTLASCAALYPVDVKKFGEAGAPPRDSDDIEVFYNDPPARPHVDVASLWTESVNYDNPGHAVARLRSVAAEHGADAIIIEKRGMRATSALYPAAAVERDFGFALPAAAPTDKTGGYSYASYARAVAIRWIRGGTPDFDRIPRAAARAESVPAVSNKSAARRTEDSPFFELTPATQPKK